MKKFFQSKTIWTGLATIMTGIGMYVSGEQQLQELTMSFVGFIFIILRLVTSTSISGSVPPVPIVSEDKPVL